MDATRHLAGADCPSAWAAFIFGSQTYAAKKAGYSIQAAASATQLCKHHHHASVQLRKSSGHCRCPDIDDELVKVWIRCIFQDTWKLNSGKT